MTLVSVIIPAFNSERYIERSIDSVINQTYTNIEIIVIDDGSTDNTSTLLRKYYEKNLVKLVSLAENKGQANAINKGILFCTGSVISLLDSDDYYLPNHIEKAVEALKQDEIDVVYSNVSHINKKGKLINKLHKLKIKAENLSNKIFGLLLFNYVIRSSISFNKNLLRITGLFDSKITGSDDLDFCVRSLLVSNIMKVNDFTVVKMSHESNISDTRLNKRTYYYSNNIRICLKLFCKTKNRVFLRIYYINLLRVKLINLFSNDSLVLTKILNKFFNTLLLILLEISTNKNEE